MSYLKNCTSNTCLSCTSNSLPPEFRVEKRRFHNENPERIINKKAHLSKTQKVILLSMIDICGWLLYYCSSCMMKYLRISSHKLDRLRFQAKSGFTTRINSVLNPKLEGKQRIAHNRLENKFKNLVRIFKKICEMFGTPSSKI